MSPLHVVGNADFDERRNTSATRPPAPGAVEACLRSMARLRREQPALCKWIADGHPHLTEEEHLRRFGVPYKRGLMEKRR